MPRWLKRRRSAVMAAARVLAGSFTGTQRARMVQEATVRRRVEDLCAAVARYNVGERDWVSGLMQTPGKQATQAEPVQQQPVQEQPAPPVLRLVPSPVTPTQSGPVVLGQAQPTPLMTAEQLIREIAERRARYRICCSRVDANKRYAELRESFLQRAAEFRELTADPQATRDAIVETISTLEFSVDQLSEWGPGGDLGLWDGELRGELPPSL